MTKAADHLPDLDSFKRKRVKDSMRIYSQKANPKHIQKSFERMAALRVFVFFCVFSPISEPLKQRSIYFGWTKPLEMLALVDRLTHFHEGAMEEAELAMYLQLKVPEVVSCHTTITH